MKAQSKAVSWHHKERQAVEQAIYAEVGKHLATLDLLILL